VGRGELLRGETAGSLGEKGTPGAEELGLQSIPCRRGRRRWGGTPAVTSGNSGMPTLEGQPRRPSRDISCDFRADGIRRE
jgi:hypothetical protein